MTDNTPMPFSIEHATLRFRNFSGVGGQYNQEGNRTFVLQLDQDTAEKLENDGWNVSYLPPLNDDEPPVPILRVAVKWNDKFRSTASASSTRPPWSSLTPPRSSMPTW